ncbi:MAG: lipopolysaccharide transport periplasmic protein LptA, partial [Pseudomonadota bacterium]
MDASRRSRAGRAAPTAATGAEPREVASPAWPRALAATVALAAACAAGTPRDAVAAAPQIQPDRPITLDARSSDFDYRRGTLVFRGVRIAQGPLSVEADGATATGLDFADSRWSFRGNVRITVEGGALASDAADVVFVDNELSTATITGRPATFEQKREDGVARGRAERIEYRFDQGTVRLAGSAWLSDGPNEIRGRTLVYSMTDKRVLAAAAEQGDERVRITINPKSPPGAAPKAGRPADPKAPAP